MSITEQLREAMETGGKSRYALAKETGIAIATVHRFYWNIGGLSANGIDLMAEALGLELKPKAKPKRPARKAAKRPAVKAAKRPTKRRTSTKKGG